MADAMASKVVKTALCETKDSSSENLKSIMTGIVDKNGIHNFCIMHIMQIS
jgi:hypothetical protein